MGPHRLQWPEPTLPRLLEVCRMPITDTSVFRIRSGGPFHRFMLPGDRLHEDRQLFSGAPLMLPGDRLREDRQLFSWSPSQI